MLTGNLQKARLVVQWLSQGTWPDGRTLGKAKAQTVRADHGRSVESMIGHGAAKKNGGGQNSVSGEERQIPTTGAQGNSARRASLTIIGFS